MGISFIATLFLARLLSPTEIGTFSVGVVLVGIAHVIRDFGVGRYIIQEKELTADRVRAAFLVTLVLAWVLAALLALLSSPVSDYYRTPGIRNVMLVLAGNFLLLPFGSITMAYLRREMNFGAAYRIKTAAALAHACTGVTMAFLGFSYMSLAWAATAGVVTTVVGCAYYRPKDMPWLPGTRELKRVLSFGGYTSTTSIVHELGTAAPDLLLGRILDVGSVAVFGRATGLIDLFNRLVANSVWTVALPHFSAKVRGGHDLRAGYVRIVHYITGVAWPFYAFMALMAYPIVHVLFGDQWDASVPLVRILCISAMLLNFNMVSSELILAHGEAKSLSKITTAGVAAKIAAIAVAAAYGLTSVAYGVVLASIVIALLPLGRLHRLAGITIGDLAAACKASLGVSLMSAAGPLLLAAVYGFESNDVWIVLPLSVFVAAIGWTAGIFLFRHELGEELRVLFGRLRRGKPD